MKQIIVSEGERNEPSINLKTISNEGHGNDILIKQKTIIQEEPADEPLWLMNLREEALNVLNKSGNASWQDSCGDFQFNLPKALEEKGVILVGILEALKKYPQFLRKYLEDKALLTHEDALQNTAFFKRGFFLYVPENLMAESPIEISFNFMDSIDKNVIIAGRNSNATIVLKEDGTAKRNCALDILLGSHAILNITALHQAETKESFLSRTATLEEGSVLHYASAMLNHEKAEMQTQIFLKGRHASLRFKEVFFAEKQQSQRIITRVIHGSPETHSSITIKGALRDNAKCYSDANVKMLKEAKDSNSHLGNHALLLNTGAMAEAIPGMEIEAKDVRAGHAASVSPINQEHLFYLMSRGIEEQEAKRIIVLGFLRDAFETTQAIDLFFGAIEKKWK